ncbi:SF1B family DNA helicase RecD2 [Longibaculum muris]|uniref:SF1B family DNA helicase RecD2 n=1 Tax=Longibaculum muris TaxID=1796628 RepID=UPI0022E4BF9F|nr:ATP-dependent RecD-like DNA helicase [Longibaculum muris]
MLEYTGIIKQVRFYSEETKFIVCVIDSEQEDKPILATGYMSYVNPQDKYHFQGDYIIHPKYGKQFQIQSYEIILADDESEIIRYLSSSLFKGIGEKQATAIVETLGKDALNKIKEDKHVLDQVRGMNEKKRETIAEVLSSQDFDQEVLSFFMGHGISTKHLALIQAVYQEHTLDILQNNPYQLIDDIDGIGFKTADDLALKIGVDPLDENRIKAAILYALKEACFQDGSTFHEHDIIFKRFHRYIPAISYEQFDDYLDQLLEEKKIIQDVEKYYPYDFYESEVTICQTFKRFIDAPLYQYEDEEVEQLLNDLQQQLSIEYDDLQKEAIHLFLKQSAMILTGGPGTGKTTIVEAIMKLYTKLNPDQSIALVAPTGRAAKRLSEVTGLEACTIHRLLKWDLHTNTFAINAQNPLDVDLLVIDEFSMVDTLLFSNLLSASRKVSKILLIGDDQQLPSVAPGHVLKDLLDCEMVPTVRLNRIYRQSQESGIVQLAHSIRNDQYDENLFFEYKDIHFQTCASYDVVKYVQVLVSKAMKEGYDANDIQVLAPMYNGVAGIDALNDCLQDLLNPHDEFKNELRVGKRIYREGDKILQLKNRIEDNVFNGDIGTLVEICYKDNFEYLTDTLIVDFDGTYVEYTANDFYTITHAYCMSIHKSQGNEFKIVIMPVLKDYYIMLRKNLIYTGLTRAKQSLFVIGNHQSFQYGIANNHDEKRRTTLKEKMLDTPTLSPYDFM